MFQLAVYRPTQSMGIRRWGGPQCWDEQRLVATRMGCAWQAANYASGVHKMVAQHASRLARSGAYVFAFRLTCPLADRARRSFVERWCCCSLPPATGQRSSLRLVGISAHESAHHTFGMPPGGARSQNGRLLRPRACGCWQAGAAARAHANMSFARCASGGGMRDKWLLFLARCCDEIPLPTAVVRC